MRLALVAAGAALILVPGAMSAPPKAVTIGTRGSVASISADGGRVAIHAIDYDAGAFECYSGAVWAPATRRVVRLQDPRPCDVEERFIEYDGLALAGTRVVWTDYDTGNHLYCTGPFVATVAKPKGVSANKCPEEPDNEDMTWEYKGDGSLLVARSYTACEASCGPDYSKTYDANVVLWSIGAGGAKKLAAEKTDTKLLDVDAGRILLRDPAKKLLVLNGAGKQVASLPVDASSAWLDGAGHVSVPAGTTLTTYAVATGKVAETCTLKAGAKVQDVENGYAVYFAGTEVHLLTIATNADRVVARVKGLVQADLEPGGLYYAYNVPDAKTKPGRVTFVPR